MEYMEQHCMLCGRRLGTTKYCTMTHSTTVQLLGLDVTSDDPLIHHNFFCNSCFLMARRISKQQPGLSKKCDVLEWLPHDDDNCDICDSKCKGGCPKKKKSGGHPSALWQHTFSQ